MPERLASPPIRFDGQAVREVGVTLPGRAAGCQGARFGHPEQVESQVVILHARVVAHLSLPACLLAVDDVTVARGMRSDHP